MGALDGHAADRSPAISRWPMRRQKTISQMGRRALCSCSPADREPTAMALHPRGGDRARAQRIDLDSGIAIELDPGRNAVTLSRGLIASLQKRGTTPVLAMSGLVSIPLGLRRWQAAERVSWTEVAGELAGMIARSGRPRLSRTICGRRWAHRAQCRWLRGARARLCARKRCCVFAGAGDCADFARCRSPHDLFPPHGRCGPILDHREISRLAQIVGAHRTGLRT